MKTTTETLELALDALQASSISINNFGVLEKSQAAIAAIKQALLAQPEQEPSAWVWHQTSIVGIHKFTSPRVSLTKPEAHPNVLFPQPLYTHPAPPKKIKADVTDEMMNNVLAKYKGFTLISPDVFADVVNAYLTEINK